MKKTIFLLCFCAPFLNSCFFFIGGFGFIYEQHLTGNYYLVAVDVIEDCSLTYHEEEEETESDKHWWDKSTGGGSYGVVIGPVVFAVGFNEDYLIAKRCIFSDSEAIGRFSHQRPIDSICYYILPLEDSMNYRTMNGLMGPFTLPEFEEKRGDLGISDILFSVEEPAISKWVKQQGYR